MFEAARRQSARGCRTRRCLRLFHVQQLTSKAFVLRRTHPHANAGAPPMLGRVARHLGASDGARTGSRSPSTALPRCDMLRTSSFGHSKEQCRSTNRCKRSDHPPSSHEDLLIRISDDSHARCVAMTTGVSRKTLEGAIHSSNLVRAASATSWLNQGDGQWRS
jgi:hypothetical protein